MAARKTHAAKRRAKKTVASPRGANGSEYLYAMGPLGAAQLRIERQGIKLKRWALQLKVFGLPSDDAIEALEQACEYVTKAVTALGEIPKGWKPARGTLGLIPLEEGVLVTLREAHQTKYEGIIDDLTASMKVVKVVGGRVVCDLGGGFRMPIVRAHLQTV
jgi:hypothetical protein